MPYLDSLDIANRAQQHIGGQHIDSVTEDTKRNFEAAFAYDKLRRAELRRNIWRFAVRKAPLRAIDTNTKLLVPDAYDATKTYLPGAVVSDSNGMNWISQTPNNINNTPGDTEVWDIYFGPMSVSAYDANTSYYAGELVYKAGSTAGSYSVYLSLQNDNSDVPSTATDYDATVTYGLNDVVAYSGSQWRSLLPINLGITPADGPLDYDSGATYSTGNTVTGSDHFIYQSVGSGNTGHDPVTDGGVHWTNTGVANAWSRSPTISTSSIKWRVLDATLSELDFIYPIGSGPLSQSTTKNVFRLPSGYIRVAPQAPKQGYFSVLGAPAGLPANDWEFESDFLITTESQVIIFRFVADVVRVTAMDDMFCEGLACRMALALCEPNTQSSEKFQRIAAEYKQFMGDARSVNSIESGAEELPLDDFIACRV